MGDAEIAQKVIEVFLEDIPGQIEAMKRSLEASDADGVCHVAHTIKGAAANIGGEALRRLAAEVEAACRNGQFETVLGREGEFEQAFKHLQEKLQDALDNEGGKEDSQSICF